MSGSRAKALRRAAYGDLSLRIPRVYGRMTLGRRILPSIVNAPDSPRAVYQRSKRGWA